MQNRNIFELERLQLTRQFSYLYRIIHHAAVHTSAAVWRLCPAVFRCVVSAYLASGRGTAEKTEDYWLLGRESRWQPPHPGKGAYWTDERLTDLAAWPKWCADAPNRANCVVIEIGTRHCLTSMVYRLFRGPPNGLLKQPSCSLYRTNSVSR